MSLVDQGICIETDTTAAMTVPHQAPASARLPKTTAVGGTLKRAADIAVAGLVLAVLSPLFLFVALIVRASGPGPVFFGHERIGLGGRTFRCLKFRTMCVDAEAVLRAHLEADPEAAREWDETQKLRRDPRVTPAGRILREYSLDELPQLLNVLRGEMSLVGPRPVVARELSRYGNRTVHYLSARPGITGLWQVSGRSDTSYETRVSLDARYVTDWSLAGDLAILARTVPVVLGARGSY
jgi:exopolysaccharide production protein ExoY